MSKTTAKASTSSVATAVAAATVNETKATSVAGSPSLVQEASVKLAEAQKYIDETSGLTKDQIAKVLSDALCQPLSDGSPAYKSVQYVSRMPNYFDRNGTNAKIENRVGKAEGTPGSSRTLRALFTQELCRYGIPSDQKAVINTSVGKFAQLQKKWLASDDPLVHGLGIQSIPADKLAVAMAAVKAAKAAKVEA